MHREQITRRHAIRLVLSRLAILLFATLPTPALAQIAVDPSLLESSARQVDPEVFLAELRAQGLDLTELRPDAETQNFRTPEELRAARYAEVFARAKEFPDEPVHVLVKLQELPPFAELGELRSMTDEERQGVVAVRRSSVQAAQRSFAEHARLQGAIVGESLFTSNRVAVRIPPSAISQILDHPDVRDVYPGWHEVTSNWNPQEIRDQSFLQRFHDAQFFGLTGGRSQSSPGFAPIRIAIIDGPNDPSGPNHINNTHLNWRGHGPGTSIQHRVMVKRQCFYGAPCQSVGSTNEASHTTTVASIAASGAVEFGAGRAGVAPDARIYVTRLGDLGDLPAALNLAIADGVDVLILPIGWRGPPWCDPQADGGSNDALRAASDAGILIVGGSSNRQQFPEYRYPYPLSCNVEYPMSRPEVVSVGGIGDKGSTTPYFGTPLGAYSGRGWIWAGRGGSHGGILNISAVSIVAPGVFEGYMTEGADTFQDTSTNPTWDDELDGVSFSAPVVGGAAGLYREWMGVFNPTYANQVGYVRAMILAMGNGIGARATWGDVRAGVGEEWGSGKFFGHPPHVLPDWGAMQYAFNVPEGWSLPTWYPQLPASTTVFKVAAFIDVGDLTQVPHILLIVRDACNGNQVIGHDIYFGTEKYVRINRPTIEGGVCPVVELYGYSVASPPSTVYVFAYWTSGSPVEH
ncbi:MAG: S8 family peptidase [Myxococcales bacterium]|nr:S8 family peptidase [Myxococcales bacterium]